MANHTTKIIIASVLNGILGALIFIWLFKENGQIQFGEANKFTKDFLFQAFILGHVSALIAFENQRKTSLKENGSSPLTFKSNYLKSWLYAPMALILLGLPLYFISTNIVSFSTTLTAAATVKFFAGVLITAIMMLITLGITQKFSRT